MNESQIAGHKEPEDKERLMGSPAQSRSKTAQSMFSPLSVTREREKTDEGEAQTETEAPERPQSKTFSLLKSVTRHKRRQREEGEGQSQPEEPRRQRREMPRRKLRRGPRAGFLFNYA